MEFYYGISNSSSLYHFGTKEHSGRYKWGSGDRPYQRLGGKERRQLKKTSRKEFLSDYAKEHGRKLTSGEKAAVKRRSDMSLKGESFGRDAIKRQEDTDYLNKEYPGERGKVEKLDIAGARYGYMKKHPYAFTVKEEAQARKEYHRTMAARALGSALLGPLVGGTSADLISNAKINLKRANEVEESGRLTYNQYADLYNKKYAKEISSGDMPEMKYIKDVKVKY